MNSWIELLDSKVPKVQNISEIISLISELMPQTGMRKGLFCPEVELKLKTILWMVYFYEETAIYGAIPRVYDPKRLLETSLERIAPSPNNQFFLFKTFNKFSRELRNEV